MCIPKGKLWNQLEKRGMSLTRTSNAGDGISVKSIWTKSPHYGWQQTSIISTIQCNLLLTCCRYRSHSLQNAWLSTGENVAFNVESQCYANTALLIRSTISTNMIYIFAPFCTQSLSIYIVATCDCCEITVDRMLAFLHPKF